MLLHDECDGYDPAGGLYVNNTNAVNSTNGVPATRHQLPDRGAASISKSQPSTVVQNGTTLLSFALAIRIQTHR
jgi:hypothetical protein